jgi:hypothetical protein
LDQSKNYKLIILGQDKYFVEELISIIGTRYSGVCVPLEEFSDVEEHFVHSIPPDGVIVQTGHKDFAEFQ